MQPCKEWNTIAEEIIQNKRKQLGRVKQLQQVKHQNLTNKRKILLKEIRMDTTDAELNRVLGGGIVPVL
jgi:DNA repair protein RadA/Sms